MLDTMPLELLAQAIRAWSEERRTAFMDLLLRRQPPSCSIRGRQWGSVNEWKYVTSPEQRARLISLVAGGMTIKDAAREVGIEKYTTAVSIVHPRRRLKATAAPF